eukprot:339316-Rhodomonas_salina.2
MHGRQAGGLSLPLSLPASLSPCLPASIPASPPPSICPPSPPQRLWLSPVREKAASQAGDASRERAHRCRGLPSGLAHSSIAHVSTAHHQEASTKSQVSTAHRGKYRASHRQIA